MGIACRPRLVASSSELMSGGTEVSLTRDDVAVLQRRRSTVDVRKQGDVLLADRGLRCAPRHPDRRDIAVSEFSDKHGLHARCRSSSTRLAPGRPRCRGR